MSFDFDYRIQNLSEYDDPGKNEWSSGYLKPCDVQGFPGKMIFFSKLMNSFLSRYLCRNESILKIHNKIEFFFPLIILPIESIIQMTIFLGFLLIYIRFL